MYEIQNPSDPFFNASKELLLTLNPVTKNRVHGDSLVFDVILNNQKDTQTRLINSNNY